MKTITINKITYTIESVTAIALNSGDTERQHALFVFSTDPYGETHEDVVFGYEMPESVDDFAMICEDSSAWDGNFETIATVERNEDNLI